MLPLWRDRIGVEFSPHGVTWVRMAPGLRPGVIARGEEKVVSQPGQPSWQAALEILKAQMQGSDWKRAGVTIVLSNHFVHYDCLPWNEAVKNENELLALARHRMTTTYGPAAQSWELRLSASGRGESRVAAAVDGALIEALRESAAAAGLPLESIQPGLMACFNRTARRLVLDDGWFVTAEAGRFALALFHDGQWQRIQLRRGDGIAALHEWLDRENMAGNQEMSCREVFLFAPGLPRDAVLPAYQMHWLELPAYSGYSPITDSNFSLAMSGVI